MDRGGSALVITTPAICPLNVSMGVIFNDNYPSPGEALHYMVPEEKDEAAPGGSTSGAQTAQSTRPGKAMLLPLLALAWCLASLMAPMYDPVS